MSIQAFSGILGNPSGLAIFIKLLRIGGLLRNWFPNKIHAKSQLIMVTFHWRNIGSLKRRVAEPKTNRATQVRKSFFSTIPFLNFSYATCKVTTYIIEAVAFRKSLPVKKKTPKKTSAGSKYPN